MNQQKYQQESNGTSQGERLPRELRSDYLNLDSRDFEDMLRQMALFSHNVNYFSDPNSICDSSFQCDESWSLFFKDIFNWDEIPNTYGELNLEKLWKWAKEGNIPPHLSLIMAFLMLFRVQQKNFNTIPDRHLQFYYQDVLGFKPKNGEVGKATVFFEIAKGFDSVLVPKGTLFDAGKDVSGKPITYVSVDDLELNKARVKSLEACVCDGDNGRHKFLLLDAPKAESSESLLNHGSALPVNYGFAVSSPRLNVEEGADMQFQMKGDNFFSLSLSLFDISYTGESGWISISEFDSVDNQFQIAKDEKIVPYDKKIHGEGFDSKDPIIRFVARDLNSYNFSPISIPSWPKLTVRMNGVRDLLIENEFGTFPNQVGVLAFGPVYKAGDKFSIRATMEDVEVSAVKGELVGMKPLYVNGNEVFATESYDPQEDAIELAKQVVDYYGTNYLKSDDSGKEDSGQTTVASNSRNPLVAGKFDEEQIFDVFKYIESVELRKEVNAQVSNASSGERVGYKFPVSIKKIFTATIQFDVPSYQIHLFTPLGILRSGDVKEFNDPNSFSGLCLFPELVSVGDEDAILLSLEGIASSTVVSLYFSIDSMMGGRSDDATPRWSYMKKNYNWEDLGEGYLLKDGTSFFRRSGVVYLRIPKDALLSSGLVRFKIAFAQKKCDLAMIKGARAQAVEVEYNPASQGSMSAGQILVANSIKKTVNAIGGVKKVMQLYDGEPGEFDETTENFNCRVSERLRHKGRAWTNWDYERLVLNRFPQIAAVKCMRSMNEKGELTAGKVLLIVIPDHRYLKNDESEFDFCPKIDDVDGDLGREVAEYFEEIASPFVELIVISPTYVKQKVKVSLKLKPGYSESSCKVLINDQLCKFIAPWSDNSSNASFSNKKKNVSDILFFLENIECVESVDAQSIELSVDCEQSYNEEQNLVIYTSVVCHTIIFNN
ncbi:MAG: baseplate J/gp47 family protein [Paludibacteraceae bacterium]|nr:baseplate J/gp47 family protein [Paludibacteraceae bacterium]